MDWQPGAPRELSEDDRKAWDGRIDRADRTRKNREKSWDDALERYRRSKAANYDVNALLDFRHVETKKAQLFYQTPEVQLHPIDPQNPQIPVDLLSYRQKVLNHYLGPDGTDVKRTVHEALFDCLAPSGWLVTEIGYDVRTAKDPLTGIDVPVWGKPFFSRNSPKKLLVPDDFRSTQFDKAPWLGIKGVMPLKRAKREFALPEDFSGSTNTDESVFEHGEKAESGDPLVEFTKIWYRAEEFDETVINPELFRLLILVKGMDEPAKHIDSPFQMVDELGQLTPMSMRGNPIHVGTLRDLSDSAYIPSDLEMGEQLANELNKFRTTQTRNRVRRAGFDLIDPGGFPAEEVEKIRNGEKTVFTNPGLLTSGQGLPIQAAIPAQEPRDNYTAQDYIERDWQGALGTGDNQTGQLSKKKTTATEARITQGNSSARAEAEKDRLREWFIAGVRKFDSVLSWTMQARDLEGILGAQGAALWEQWRQLSGCYTYKILPDSGIHVDAAQFRAQKLDEYNLLRKDPQVNATELITGVVRALGYDPAKTVLPQAPEQGPEPIKTSMSFKLEDFLGPQAEIGFTILAQMGITIPPDAIARLEAQKGLLMATGQLGVDGKPPKPVGDPSASHGGSAPSTTPVNKHQEERTGGVQGVGIQ